MSDMYATNGRIEQICNALSHAVKPCETVFDVGKTVFVGGGISNPLKPTDYTGKSQKARSYYWSNKSSVNAMIVFFKIVDKDAYMYESRQGQVEDIHELFHVTKNLNWILVYMYIRSRRWARAINSDTDAVLLE